MHAAVGLLGSLPFKSALNISRIYVVRLRRGPCGGWYSRRTRRPKQGLGEHMVQAKTLVIRLYYHSWKSIIFVPVKDQPPELVS